MHNLGYLTDCILHKVHGVVEEWSIEEYGISDLVIVTTKENHAQHVYRSMGFDLHSFQYGNCLSKPYLP